MMSLHAHVHSPTGAMHDVFQARMAELEQYLAAFKPVPEQKGLLVLINGEVAGLDLVSLERAYQLLHPQFLKSYAMDAVLDQKETPAVGIVEKAKQFLDEAAQCKETRYHAVGLGTDHRFEGKQIAGSALVFENTVVHAALFNRLGLSMGGFLQHRVRRPGAE
jgi:hypothetical protein